MTKTTELKDLSMSFAIKIIRLCETIQGHSSLRSQLERSATSIGANLRDANYAHSKIDFISKLKIALKECYESEYWLELFKQAELTSNDTAVELTNIAGKIRRMLIASINTAEVNP